MTDIVNPPTISSLPAAPQPTDTPAAFNTKSFALLGALDPMVTQINAAADATEQNATAANERAVSANSAKGAAESAASAANADALRLASLDALWLGAAASDPATGRGGAPLVAGNAYVNTVSGLLRGYNGSAWVDGLNVTAGVTSLNGQAGALALKTVGGASLLGSGDIAVSIPFSQVSQHTATGTFTAPSAGVIRAYAIGAGASGTGTASGGGGGCAYGDISVTAGQIVSISIVAGVAKVTIAGVDLLTANPASGLTGGTAIKHASVLNGGAYSGGDGATGGFGGASSGSPLGAGVAGNNAGGAGWGGPGNAVGNGGGVGSVVVNARGGDGLPVPSSDPLLSNLTGRGGARSTVIGVAGSFGGGGGAGGNLGGAGGFGGGGGAMFDASAGNSAGEGGFGGGGGASTNSSGIGGAGGFGGGGGRGVSGGGTGGGAVVRIYY